MWVFSAKVREQRHFSSYTIAFKRTSLGRLLLKKEQLRISTFLEKCVLFALYHNPPVAQGPWFCSGVTDNYSYWLLSRETGPCPMDGLRGGS